MGKKVNNADCEMEADHSNENNVDQVLKYEDKLKFANAIAQPMASKKLNKKLIKLLKKAKEEKKNLRFGLKDVQRYIQKGETGLVILAGDVTPIDVMCHIPGLCEEKNIPYCYIPSKRDLALAVGFTTSCLMALVKENPDYSDLYHECRKEVQTLGHPM